MEFFHKNPFLQDSRGNTCAGVRQVFTLRSSHSEVSCEKGVLKICSKCRGKHPCRSVVSKKLLGNFIEITRCHGCSLVNVMHVFRTLAPQNTSGGLLLYPTTSLKETTPTQMFSDEFYQVLQTRFLQNPSRQLFLFYGKIFYQYNSKEPSQKRKTLQQLVRKQ